MPFSNINSQKWQEFIFGFVLIIYLSGFVFNNFNLSFIIRGAEIVIVCLGALYLGRYNLKQDKALKIILFTLAFLFLITFSMLLDSKNSESSLLYFKTILYIMIGFLGGLVGGKMLDSPIHNKNINTSHRSFFKGVYLSTVLISFLLIYSALKYSWAPGVMLLGTELGDLYQGLSRAIGTIILILVLIRRENSKLIFYGLTITLFSLMLAFNSFGAFIPFLLSLFLYFKVEKFKLILLSLAGFLFIIYDYDYLFNFITSDTSFIQIYLDRFQGKINSSIADEQSRNWLMYKAYEVWSSSLSTILFGVGPIEYSCYVDYCSGYRHPHNFFLLNLIWFGLPGLLIFSAFMRVFFRASKVMIHKDSMPISLFLSALFVNFFILSMIGGDFEQNRHLILLFFIFLTKGMLIDKFKH